MILPKHIAFILDGNRRFGEKLGNRLLGHKIGTEHIKEVLDWCKELGIKIVTIWAMSTENFSRPKEEVELLLSLMEEKLSELMEDREFIQRVKVNFIGNLQLFPQRFRELMTELSRATSSNTEFILNIAIGYGGREELTTAMRKIAQKIKEGTLEPKQITHELITQHLYTNGLPDPDLIIRTGGEIRNSGFMLWQSEYSEWHYTNVLWPEFSKEDLIRALVDFSERHRRFGR